MAFTFFFRDLPVLETAIEKAYPAISGKRFINIWDAGCAYGPEPYSMAILLRERMSRFLFRNVRIYATDIDGNFGKVISEGMYSATEVGRIPSDIKSRYFSTDSTGNYIINSEIRESVKFTQMDLLQLKPVREDLDIIICKNVLLHFSPEERCSVISMFHNSLVSGGILVMENTQNLPDSFCDSFQRVSQELQIFQKIENRREHVC